MLLSSSMFHVAKTLGGIHPAPSATPRNTKLMWPIGNIRCSTRNTVYEVLKSRPGWVETQDDVDWDLCWADVGWVRDMYDQIQVGETKRGSAAKTESNFEQLFREMVRSKMAHASYPSGLDARADWQPKHLEHRSTFSYCSSRVRQEGTFPFSPQSRFSDGR